MAIEVSKHAQFALKKAETYCGHDQWLEIMFAFVMISENKRRLLYPFFRRFSETPSADEHTTLVLYGVRCVVFSA